MRLTRLVVVCALIAVAPRPCAIRRSRVHRCHRRRDKAALARDVDGLAKYTPPPITLR